uniref:Uncharacterized protein n=1 Tax=Anguilla anguilla TaxID=7936 RepID=A0A0E9Q8Q9_ANGAN
MISQDPRSTDFFPYICTITDSGQFIIYRVMGKLTLY